MVAAAAVSAESPKERRQFLRRRSKRWKTPRPVQVGSQIDFVAHFLGRRLAYTYEVVEFVPGRRLTMRTPGAPFPMETTYTWEDENGATRMTLCNRGTPRGILGVVRAGDVTHGPKGQQEGSRVPQTVT
jgi:hypothetical protein